MITISRRRFLALTGGLLATGCTASRATTAPDPGSTGASTATTGTTTAGAGTGTTPTTTGVVTTIATPAEAVAGDRVLVLVELRGGNDAVNTLPPLTGAYRDLRPTIALDEADIVLVDSLPDHGLHPSLAPLTAFADSGRLAALAGIGFPNPDRSHFVSMDRWAQADRLDDHVGWLGRWLDSLPDDLAALGATSLGNRGDALTGALRTPTVIDDVDAFAFPAGLSNASIRLLGEPLSDDPLLAAAQRSFIDSVGAIEEFDEIADAVRAKAPERPADDVGQQRGAFTTGLAVAAEMIIGDVGTRVVTVSVSGFDTHSDQLGTHAELLADLANGLAGFWAALDEAGESDRVLLATTSEFGRRVRENASGGCDHGAAGVSFLMGSSIADGLHGGLDTSNLLDGDLQAQIDPRVLFTACLDWLGGDAEQILGRRYDDLTLLA